MKNILYALIVLFSWNSVANAQTCSMSDGMGGFYHCDGSSSLSDGMGGFYHSDGSSSLSDGMGGFYHTE